MKKFFLFAFFAFIPLFSCAYTEITSFKDPEFENVSFSNLIVIFQDDDLKIVKLGEEIFQDEFQRKGYVMHKGLNVLLPTRNYSTDEEKDEMLKKNIDAVLNVRFKSAHTEKEYHYSQGHGRVTSTKKDFLTFKVELKDINKDKIAWTASTTTSGDNLSLDNYLASLASAVRKKLIRDSLITK